MPRGRLPGDEPGPGHRKAVRWWVSCCSSVVPAAGGGGSVGPGGGKGGGEQVGGSICAFQASPDDERAVALGDATVGVPDGGRADHVDHAGFVFEVEEAHASGGGWFLFVGDQPGNAEVLPVASVGELVCGD